MDESTRNRLRNRAEDLLLKAGRPALKVDRNDPQVLLEELMTYHAQLEVQNAELRDAQARLETSRARYFELFDMAPVGYVTLDRNGVINEVNLTAAEMLGVGRSFLKNMVLSSMVASGYKDAFFRHLEQIINTRGKAQCEIQMRKAGGSTFYVRMSSSFMESSTESRTSVWVTLIDITDEKESEKELQSTYQRFYAILSSSYAGIVLVTKEGVVEYANQAMCDLFDIDGPPEGLKGLTSVELFGKVRDVYEQPDEMLARINDIVDQNEPIKGEEIAMRGGRTCLFDYVPLAIGGEPYGRLWSHVDITELKRAEQELRASEAKYRLVFNQSPIGMMRFDSTGAVTDCNTKMSDMLGAPKERIIGFNILASATDQEFRGTVESALSGGIGVHEGEYTSATGGKTSWGKMVSAPLTNQEGLLSGGIAIVEDLTERKRTHDELQESQERFRLIADTITEVFWMADVETSATFYVSSAYENIWGRSLESLYKNPRSFIEAVHEDDREKVLATLEGKRTHDRFDYEYRIVRPDGAIRWIRDRGFPIHENNGLVTRYAGIAEDITERNLAQEDQTRLIAAIEQAAEGVVIMDPQGIIQYVNSGYEKITGSPREEVLWTKHHLFEPEEHDGALHSEVQETLVKGLSWSGRVSRAHKNGSSYTEDVRLSAVRDNFGKIVNYVAIKRDVSQELSMQRQLLQSQKMEAVGTLAGGIAHDFNNILQVSSGYSELLLGCRQETDHEYDDLYKINSASIRGADLVQNLMMFSRKTEPHLRLLNLNDEVAQIQKLLSRTIPKTIHMVLHLDENLDVVEADVSQMGQVLMNLAVNARDAMPDGGHLTFETSNVELHEEHCTAHPDLQPGSYVLLAVSDTGEGITKETLPHIFEPFFTTRAAGSGTGLGLATVFSIIKQHRGHILCESEMGIGTTFRIYLPAVKQKLDDETQDGNAPVQGGTETILLVEDEESLRDLESSILRDHGYEVITADNGREALDTYVRNQEKISLVILDLALPEMDGRKCLAEILNVNPKARVVIACGYSPGLSLEDTSLRMAKGMVTKPYRITELLRLVREVLDA